ncbi:helix-turn-helix domain-containing protein [Azoarcus sp. L1K30]|uniref:transcriptional regulator n=1 Tax=Azoarcus sp. L1K30 TaxID=2820277 RepID=UPI001B82AC77|nr:helix-turn-helix domain-containing protein [Azoarcus sp. L1K30]MBR0568383.1 helix-turn-helix domain-containing protein [Azoarcus sp. L1K30]
MKLHDYLSKSGTPQAKLAKAIGVPPVLVHQWAHGKRPVPAERCPAIEKETGGEVRCEDLRPDVDWAYLRGTSRSSPAGATA